MLVLVITHRSPDSNHVPGTEIAPGHGQSPKTLLRKKRPSTISPLTHRKSMLAELKKTGDLITFNFVDFVCRKNIHVCMYVSMYV